MSKKNLFLFLLLCGLTASPAWTVEKQNLQQISRSFNQSYPGTVIASRHTKLAFRVGGPLIEVAVKPGDKVKKGQLLMQIDPRDFADSIRVLEAQQAAAESQLVLAQRDFERAQTLFDQQVSATADFDRAKSAFDSAFFGVQSLKAQLRIARHKLQDTALRAPYAGVVTLQTVEGFEMVKAGREVLEIQDVSTLEVEIMVPENEVARRPLTPGRAVTVEFPALPGRTVSARLSEWNSSADPVTRTYALRFAFSAPSEFQVLPGMTAEVRMRNGDDRER